MFKIYQKYIIKNFINKFLVVSFIFLCLIIILSILEEISFFKDLEVNFLIPYFLTLLSAPITLFEIFPFIFLISTQLFFYELFRKDELSLLKTSGLSNIKIINILFLSSFIIGIITVLLFYNIASKLKFYHTDIKNYFSNDNKYLAVVNDSGLWLKDEIDSNTLIVKAKFIEENYLMDVIINEFDKNFNLKNTYQSKKVDINNKNWILENPKITNQNISSQMDKTLLYPTNFDKDKISNLFSNISTLNIFELFNLKKDYENLGYSSDEIIIHLLKLSSTPIFYGILTILAAIIMFNFTKNKSLFFHIILGILMSVVIYYIIFMFSSLGNNGKIPIIASIFMPILFISIFAIIGLIRVNEK
tara:strand:+ start:1862 stop:2941 length:1080 start_codon:yes stop_codon:yes gene_type:complete